MSKSLKATIEETIRMREEAKVEERNKVEESKRILISLDKELKKCLKRYEDYKGHNLDGREYNALQEEAKKLGFVTETHPFFMIGLSIPKGSENISIAKKMLNKFEEKLKQLCNERAPQLETECQRVYEEIENGHFDYYDYLGIKGETIIIVKSKDYFGNCSLEFQTIFNYFEKHDLYLIKVCDNVWHFKLKKPHKTKNLRSYF